MALALGRRAGCWGRGSGRRKGALGGLLRETPRQFGSDAGQNHSVGMLARLEAVRGRSRGAQGGNARVQGLVAIVQWEVATVQCQVATVQWEVATVQNQVALVQGVAAARVLAKQHFPKVATSTQEGPMADWDSGQHWDSGLLWDSASSPPPAHYSRRWMPRRPISPAPGWSRTARPHPPAC